MIFMYKEENAEVANPARVNGWTRSSMRRMSQGVLLLDDMPANGAQIADAAAMPGAGVAHQGGTREEKEDEATTQSKAPPQSSQARSGSGDLDLSRSFLQLLNLLVLGVVVCAYPLLILSVYRQASTTDWTRFVFVCFVHPVVKEFLVTLQRRLSSKRYRDLQKSRKMA